MKPFRSFSGPTRRALVTQQTEGVWEVSHRVCIAQMFIITIALVIYLTDNVGRPGQRLRMCALIGDDL